MSSATGAAPRRPTRYRMPCRICSHATAAARSSFAGNREIRSTSATFSSTERSNPRAATLRDQFEAFARSIRDVLAPRWALTTEGLTCARTPKLVYYLFHGVPDRTLAHQQT